MKDPKEMPNLIVLDTTTIVSDHWLRKPSFILLKEFIKRTGAKLAVPRIVLQEAANHYNKELDKTKASMKKAYRNLNHMLPTLSGHRAFPTFASVEGAIEEKRSSENYEEFLNISLSSINADIIEYKEIAHEDIVKRDLDGKKPFQPSGKGYRDTLIWESIIRHCVSKDHLTVFITANSKDFCDSKGDLHGDLKRDLLKKHFSANHVEIVSDLSLFANRYVIPLLKSEGEYLTLIQSGTLEGFDLQEACEEYYHMFTESIEQSPSSLVGSPEIYEPEISYIEIPSNFDVNEVSELSSTILFVAFSFSTDVNFVFYLPRDEYIMMSEEESEELNVLDYWWNDHVMRVETLRPVRFACTLVFNMSSKQVESFAVDKVEAEWI